MDLRKLINVSYRSVTAEQLGSVVDTITDLAVYARQNHITVFNITWRPFQNSFGITHLTTGQCGANQSITSRDNFYAEVAKLKLPTDWPEAMPEKVRIGFDYLELYFAGIDNKLDDTIKAHFADTMEMLAAKDIVKVEFSYQPTENNVHVSKVTMNPERRVLTNAMATVERIFGLLPAIENWTGPKTLELSIENQVIVVVGVSHE